MESSLEQLPSVVERRAKYVAEAGARYRSRGDKRPTMRCPPEFERSPAQPPAR
jgi:hypothetical protein